MMKKAVILSGCEGYLARRLPKILRYAQNDKRHFLAILTLTVLWITTRAWGLLNIPPGLFHDEAYYLLDAIHTQISGRYHTFYPGNNGREGLFMWLLSGVLNLTNADDGTQRLLAAKYFLLLNSGVMAIASAGIAMLLFKDHPYRRWIALLTVALLLSNFWTLHLSRLMFRAGLLPTVQALVMLILLYAWRSQCSGWLWLAGVVMGIGFYSYTAYPAILLPAGIILYLCWRAGMRVGVVACILLMGITATPLYLTIQQAGFARVEQVSIWQSPTPLMVLMHNSISSITMLFWDGDHFHRHNLPGLPMLSVLAMVGIVASLYIAIRKSESRLPLLFLLVWYGAVMLPMIVTTEGIPHALRAGGGIVPIHLLAAYGLCSIASRRRYGILVLVLALIAQTVLTMHQYYGIWLSAAETRHRFWADMSDDIHTLQALPDDTRKIVIVPRVEDLPKREDTLLQPGMGALVPLLALEVPDIRMQEKRHYQFMDAASAGQNPCNNEPSCTVIRVIPAAPPRLEITPVSAE